MKKTELRQIIREEIQTLLEANPKDLEFKGEYGKGMNAVRFWKDKKTGKIYRDVHPKIKEVPGDTLQHVTGNYIPKDLREEVIKENFVDNFLNHLGKVLQKGRAKQVQKDVAKANPELAKAVGDFDNAQKRIENLLSDLSDDERKGLEDRFYSQFKK